MAARYVYITELNYFNDCCGVGEEVDDGGICPRVLGMGCTVALWWVAKEDSRDTDS